MAIIKHSKVLNHTDQVIQLFIRANFHKLAQIQFNYWKIDKVFKLLICKVLSIFKSIK